MELDLHVSRFDWAGGDDRIGPGVRDLAQRAEAIGVRTLSFMDHFFQMDWMAPAEHPMLEGYTALGFVAGALVFRNNAKTASELEQKSKSILDALKGKTK